MRGLSIVLGLLLLVAGFAISALLAIGTNGALEAFVAVLPAFVLLSLAIHIFNDGLGQLLSDFGLRGLGQRVGRREGLDVR